MIINITIFIIYNICFYTFLERRVRLLENKRLKRIYQEEQCYTPWAKKWRRENGLLEFEDYEIKETIYTELNSSNNVLNFKRKNV